VQRFIVIACDDGVPLKRNEMTEFCAPETTPQRLYVVSFARFYKGRKKIICKIRARVLNTYERWGVHLHLKFFDAAKRFSRQKYI
jgi:hypothetical protein